MHEGSDATETVHVVLDADGLVTDVSIERLWWEKVDSRRFGTAVLEAIQAAGVRRLSSWAAGAPDAGTPDAEPPPAAKPAGPVELNPDPAMINRVLDLINGAQAQLRELNAADATEAAAGESDGGHVTVYVSDMQVVEIDMEPRWLGLASNLEIAAELRDALRSAYQADETGRADRGTGPIAELRRLTANPQQFVTALFGITSTRTGGHR